MMGSMDRVIEYPLLPLPFSRFLTILKYTADRLSIGARSPE
jgi:hypothetical protein